MSASNPAPGFSSHPNHSVEINKADGIVGITLGDELIAQTSDALILKENTYANAYYLPKSTLPESMLQPSDHTTYCPFKGEASYYHLSYNGQVYENAIWCYASPFDEALKIKDHIAIYPNIAKVATISE